MKSFRGCPVFFRETGRYFCWFIVLISSLILFPCPPGRCDDAEKFLSYIETFSQGSIDWDSGMIYGYGKSYTDEYADKKKAITAARMMASSNIVRLAAGIRLDDAKFMKSMGESRVSIRIEAFVITKSESIQLIADGPRPYYEIIRMAPVKGIEGLTARLIDHVKKEPVPWLPPPEKTKETALEDDNQPWLVLDARHLSDQAAVKPAVFPKIITSDGTTIYSPSQVFEHAVKQRGMARYVTSRLTHRQIQSSWKKDIPVFEALMTFLSSNPALAEDSPKKKRTRQSFVIKNVNEAGGLLNTNLVISAKDAEELKEEDAASKILKNCRVIVVISSPVSGIEGMTEHTLAWSGPVIPEE